MEKNIFKVSFLMFYIIILFNVLQFVKYLAFLEKNDLCIKFYLITITFYSVSMLFKLLKNHQFQDNISDK